MVQFPDAGLLKCPILSLLALRAKVTVHPLDDGDECDRDQQADTGPQRMPHYNLSVYKVKVCKTVKQFF